MNQKTRISAVLILSLVIFLLTGCSTLSVQAPPGMFVSTGDYVPGIRTMGIIQEKTRVWAPLFMIDVNQVHERLYKQLIDKAEAVGADGVTNIRFSWKPSPISYFTIVFLTPVLDFYVEAVAIED